MAGLVKYAARPKDHYRMCEEMLRQQRQKIKRRFCPAQPPLIHSSCLILYLRPSEWQLGAHTVNPAFVLHTRAALKMLHLLCVRCCDAAKKPVIHTSCSEQETANSYTAGKVRIC